MDDVMENLNGMRNVICIAGPTASGKTGFAIRLAKHVGGEIINADALQVYADMLILSAQPTPDEMKSVPHHLFGHVSGGQVYSVGHWLREAVPIILDVMARHRTPIVTGGTGLYFKGLLVGLADIPDIASDRMARLAKWPIERLREEAERLDPLAASRVLGHDPQRLQRIVGVALETGTSLSTWQQETRPVIPDRYVRKAVLMPDRAELYRRIEHRFDSMMKNGALEEAQRIRAKRYSDRAPMLKAIGLSHLLSHLDGACDLEEAVETAKRDTRRLSKRQSTWFRNQCADWPKLTDASQMDAFARSL